MSTPRIAFRESMTTRSLSPGERISASDMVIITNAAGSQIQDIYIRDDTPGGGYFELDGQSLAHLAGTTLRFFRTMPENQREGDFGLASFFDLNWVAGGAGARDNLVVNARIDGVTVGADSLTVSVPASQTPQPIEPEPDPPLNAAPEIERPVVSIVEVSPTDISEGSGLTFAARLSHPSTETITVAYQVTGRGLNPASADDFRHANGFITIPAGARTVTGAIFAEHDNLIEGTEGFLLRLTQVTQGNATLAPLSDRSLTGTIIDRTPETNQQPADNKTILISLPFVSDSDVHVVQGIGGSYSHKNELYNSWDFAITSPEYPWASTFGMPVVATARGAVVDFNNITPDGSHVTSPETRGPSGLGNFITLQHDINGQKFYSSYIHLQQNSIPEGTALGTIFEEGQIIGRVGNTGSRAGTHLHFHVGTDTHTWNEIWNGRRYITANGDDDANNRDLVNNTLRFNGYDSSVLPPSPHDGSLRNFENPIQSISTTTVDIAANTGTQASLAIGQSVVSAIDIPRDQDWFKTILTGGVTYEFTLESLDPSQNLDPVLRIYNADGTQRLAIDPRQNFDAWLEFTPSESGIYFVSAGGIGQTQGDYLLSAELVAGTPDPSLGDIAKYGFRINEQQIVAGESLEVEWAVRNEGPENTSQHGLTAIYLSTDDKLSSTDTLLDAFLFSSLEPWETASFYESISLPANIQPGEYWIWAISVDRWMTDVDRHNQYIQPIKIEVLELGSAPEIIQSEVGQPMVFLSSERYENIVAQTATIFDNGGPFILIGSSLPTSPVDGESRIVLEFNREVFPGLGGTVDILRSDGTYWDLIAVNATDWVDFSGNTVTITPPAEFDQGESYYVNINSGVFVDAVGNHFMGIRDNTSLAFYIDVSDPVDDIVGPSLPDLEIGSLDLQNSAFLAGDHVNFSAIIENIGKEASSATDVTAYATTDTSFADAVFLFRETIPALDAGQAVQFDGYFWYNDVPGDYYLAFIVDDTGIVTESDETNNIAYMPFRLIDAEYDTSPPVLVGTNPAIGWSDAPVGNEITLTFSEDIFAANGDIRVLRDHALVDTINVSDATRVTIEGNTLTVTLSEDLSYAANYEIRLTPGIVQDQAGNLFQGVPSGEEIRFTTTIGPAPDVLFSRFEVVGDSVSVGDPLTASWTIRNDGDLPANFGLARFYLSADPTPSDDDFMLGAMSFSQLQPGESVDILHDDMPVPLSTVPGDYWVWAELVVTNGVEANLENNIAVPVQIAVTPVNSAPTGEVIISGTARVGAFLVANTDTVEDADGLGKFSYQWFADGQEILAATDPLLMLTRGEVGKAISVTITYIDGNGTQEELNSQPTTPVESVNAPAHIIGRSSGVVVEGDIIQQQVTGILTVVDPDPGEDRFAEIDAATLAGDYGSFSFDPETGAWTYMLNNDLASVQALPEGVEVTDSLSVTSLDGTASETITVTIVGAGVVIPEPNDTIMPQSAIQGRSGETLDGVNVTFTPDDGSTAIDIASTAEGFDLAALASASGRITASRDYIPETDGNVTALDALNVLRLAVGLSPSWGAASPMDFIAADINQDGQVTALDALEVLRAAVGLQSANQPRWFFMDSDADLSHINRNDTLVEEGIRFDPAVTDISSMSMTGVLLGNMQEYAQ